MCFENSKSKCYYSQMNMFKYLFIFSIVLLLDNRMAICLYLNYNFFLHNVLYKFYLTILHLKW